MHQFEEGEKVFAARDIWLHEVYRPEVGANYVCVTKGDPGEIVDLEDDGRVWVLFDEDEWLCEKSMITPDPSIIKMYRESLIIDLVIVFFLDDHGDNMGEIEFKSDYNTGIKAIIDLPSFGIANLAADIFSALAQHHQIEFGDFVKLLKSLGYIEEETE